MGWFLIIQCFYFHSIEYIFKGVERTLWISIIYHSATKIKLWLPTRNSTFYTCLPVLCCCSAQLQNLCAFLIINILETWMQTYFFLICSVVGKGGCWQTAFPIAGFSSDSDILRNEMYTEQNLWIWFHVGHECSISLCHLPLPSEPIPSTPQWHFTFNLNPLRLGRCVIYSHSEVHCSCGDDVKESLFKLC